MALFGLRSHLSCAGFSLRLIVLTFFLGCAHPSAMLPPVQRDVYRSSERILHRIKPGDTPAMLAQKYLGAARLAWMVEDANPKDAFRPDRFAVIPLKINNRAGITDQGYQTVPILCYHRFAPSCDSPLCMPAGIFEKQLRYLKENGYRVIGPEELVEFLDYRKAIPQNAVMISIDDGYRSVYDVAYPLLKKYGFTATLFIYVDYVGVSSQAITWQQLRELKREGFYIGSHSVAHSDLSQRQKDEDDTAYVARLKREIFRSKQIIDEKLNQDTLIFSYPFGRHNPTVASLTRQAGYRIAVTVDRGSNPFFADPLRLRRDQILKRDMDRFASRLKTFTNFPLQ
ncbi:polysaccharide deacetylase family protein [Desulfosarcina sp.]|uniref:polysaccharide deacetylase family protein n=1 Tax=Desulfosarcina sp. TaxID=2027861 RepID=UPI003971092F